MLACLILQVDVYGYRCLTSMLEWMGLHSLSIFVLITSNLAIIAIQGFYLTVPENNIVSIQTWQIPLFTEAHLYSLKFKTINTILFWCTFLVFQVHWIIRRFMHA